MNEQVQTTNTDTTVDGTTSDIVVDAAVVPKKRAQVVQQPRADQQFCGDCDPTDDGEPGPAERVVYPADVTEIQPDDDLVYIIGTKDGKVTRIGGLEVLPKLKTLVLRCCLISSMSGIENLTTLEKLELYDNQLEHVTHLERLSNLRILDLSFNAIREMIPLAIHLPLLEELYMAQNKLKEISGLEGLHELRVLDLGANRIRAISGLSTNTKLKSLWLGKNKIEEIAGLEHLVHLEQLDIQNNRLTSLGHNLETLSALRELYLACNRITSVEGLPQPVSTLETIDLSTNGVTTIQGIEKHEHLQELWMSSSNISTFDELLPLTHLTQLQCLYLEHSPLAKDFEYRLRITKLLPTLQQLDATNVHRQPIVPAPMTGKFASLNSALKLSSNSTATATASATSSNSVPVVAKEKEGNSSAVVPPAPPSAAEEGTSTTK